MTSETFARANEIQQEIAQLDKERADLIRIMPPSYEIKGCHIELTLDDINMLIKARHEKIMELKAELEAL